MAKKIGKKIGSPVIQKVPWSVAFMDVMIEACRVTGGRFRYLAAHANQGTPTPLRGSRGKTPGQAQGKRDPNIGGRLSFKRMLPGFPDTSANHAHSIGKVGAARPVLVTQSRRVQASNRKRYDATRVWVDEEAA